MQEYRDMKHNCVRAAIPSVSRCFVTLRVLTVLYESTVVSLSLCETASLEKRTVLQVVRKV